MTNYFLNIGDTTAASDSCKRALTVAETLADAALTARAHYQWAQLCRRRGDYRRAIDAFKTTLRLHESAGVEKPSAVVGPGVARVFTRNWLITCLAEVGRFSEGTALGEESKRIAESADNPFSLMSTFLLLARLPSSKENCSPPFHSSNAALRFAARARSSSSSHPPRRR